MLTILALQGAAALAASVAPAEAARRHPEQMCIFPPGVLYAPCGKFGPAQHIHGIWYVGFEESGFVANAETARLVRRFKDLEAWPELDGHLMIGFDKALALAGTAYSNCTQAVAVEFIGREAFVPTDERPRLTLFAVDTLLSARVIGSVRTLGSRYERLCAKR